MSTQHITADEQSWVFWRVIQQRQALKEHYEYLTAEWMEKAQDWSPEHNEVHLSIMAETAEEVLLLDAMYLLLVAQRAN